MSFNEKLLKKCLHYLLDRRMGGTFHKDATFVLENGDVAAIKCDYELPKYFVALLKLTPSEDDTYYIYSENKYLWWFIYRMSVKAAFETNDLSFLKELCEELFYQQEKEFLNHIGSSFPDVDINYNDIKYKDDVIVFSRDSLFSLKEDNHRHTIDSGIMQGKFQASNFITVSYNSAFLWDWYFEVFYSKITDVLDDEPFADFRNLLLNTLKGN